MIKTLFFFYFSFCVVASLCPHRLVSRAMAYAEHCMPLSAVAVNGVVVAASKATFGRDEQEALKSPSLQQPPPPPKSARAFLLSRRRGAYTALAVSACGGAQFWQEHCERLAATLAIMAEAEEKEEEKEEEGKATTTASTSSSSSLFPSFRAWHASAERQVPLPLASLVGEAMLPSVRAAVSAVRGMQRRDEASTGTTTTAASSSHSRCAGRGTVNVVVLLSEPDEAPAPPTRNRHPESLPLDVAVFAWEAASSTSSTPFLSSNPLSAVVVGGARERPHAKDSSWVKAREPLEAKLSEALATTKKNAAETAVAAAAGGEGLLVDEKGRLLEGLVTNVFVVVEREEEAEEEERKKGEEAGIATASSSSSSSLSRFELQTASVEEGVLDGVMRRAVIEAAGKLGIKVALSAPGPPSSSSRQRRWREAFVTSALRGVAPLREIRGQGGGGGGGRAEGLSVELFGDDGGVPGPVTRAIAGALEGVVGHYRVQL